jgi:outer membrane protein assembly factor BamA
MMHTVRRRALFALALLLISATAEAAPRRKLPRRATYQIRDIHIDPRNVFDPNRPGEDKFPFTWANFLHIRTRPHVIAREMLVRPGMLARVEDIEESERKLRALRFIKDSDIAIVPISETQADLKVITQDAWTTQPQINFGSEGGESSFSAGILEENVFGFGKELSLFYKKDKDGRGTEFEYKDPQLLGTRWTAETQVIAGNFTDRESLNVERPFYAPQTRFATGFNAERDKEVVRVFEGGSESNRFLQESYTLGAFGGLRLNDDIFNVHRLYARYRFSKQIYRTTPTTDTGTLPTNRIETGPALEWTFRESNFIKETFIDAVERIEDYNLGHESKISLGYSAKKLGGTRTNSPFIVRDSFGWGIDSPGFGLVNFGVIGKYNYYSESQPGGRLTDSIYFWNTTYYRHLHEELPFLGILNFEAAYLQNSENNDFLELGGDRGLRGYKNRAFTGNKSLLANVEGRFFYPYEIFHLAYLGGAVFADAGQVRPENRTFTGRDIHVNVGMGLRIGLTRSTGGSLYRVDVAYALGHVTDGDRIIISVSSGGGFKRVGNAYNLND